MQRWIIMHLPCGLEHSAVSQCIHKLPTIQYVDPSTWEYLTGSNHLSQYLTVWYFTSGKIIDGHIDISSLCVILAYTRVLAEKTIHLREWQELTSSLFFLPLEALFTSDWLMLIFYCIIDLTDGHNHFIKWVVMLGGAKGAEAATWSEDPIADLPGGWVNI